ncbi:hypothetical protein Goari_018395 [Gossypium aridum]|uniref:DUF4283 domain-containing protein n=1 Tax=Gossypium aridum TaxID=34290 RepID=A0A7J8WPH6_GOSAI|nr:hypothetical protein [Gossypium aridum]
MEESGGDDREGRDEISLLAEELIQLSVKGSLVVPSEKPTLICTIWTKKLYNPESFKAQMRSIWKTRKKFEILMVRQNLFLIELIKPIERAQIRLTSSLFWIKIDLKLMGIYDV